MRILAYTPDAPTESHKIISAFVAGLARYGHHVQYRAIHHYDGPEPSDLTITVGWTPVAARIHKDQLATGKPTLSISDGFVRKGRGPGAYYAIMRNGFGAYGERATGCKADRWKELGVDLKPWRKPGKDKHILVAHQHTKTHQGGDRQDWFSRVIDYLKKNVEREIIVRGHPRDDKFKLPSGCVSSINKDIMDDLKDAHALITYDSNAVVEALIEGVPCFTFGKTMGDPLCIHDLQGLEKPDLPQQKDREQWAYDLAYCQWTVAEMREGLPWVFLTNTSLPMAKTIVTPNLPDNDITETEEPTPDIDTGNLFTEEAMGPLAEGAGNIAPPSDNTEEEASEPTPEKLAESVDPKNPNSSTVKELMAWLVVNGHTPASNTPKAHLVAKVIQVANA